MDWNTLPRYEAPSPPDWRERGPHRLVSMASGVAMIVGCASFFLSALTAVAIMAAPSHLLFGGRFTAALILWSLGLLVCGVRLPSRSVVAWALCLALSIVGAPLGVICAGSLFDSWTSSHANLDMLRLRDASLALLAIVLIANAAWTASVLLRRDVRAEFRLSASGTRRFGIAMVMTGMIGLGEAFTMLQQTFRMQNPADAFAFGFACAISSWSLASMVAGPLFLDPRQWAGMLQVVLSAFALFFGLIGVGLDFFSAAPSGVKSVELHLFFWLLVVQGLFTLLSSWRVQTGPRN